MIYAVIGTMPEAVKMLPVVEKIRELGGEVTLVFTSQHKDMAEGVFSAFGIYPDVRFSPLPEGKMAEKLSEIQFNISRYFGSVGACSADKVISLGDTLTAYGAGVCAFLSGIPFYHIEAGLRTGVWNSPYPEEALRRSLTAFSTAHFTTTADARRNLCKEGVSKGRIFEVGNTVYDSIHRFIDGEYKVENKIVFTLHRRENANNYAQILAEISKFAKENRNGIFQKNRYVDIQRFLKKASLT